MLKEDRPLQKGNRLAFCLFKYFPFGGLQRDFAHIALECIRRGFSVDAYAGSWSGDVPPGINVHILPMKGFTNHGRYRSFAAEFLKRTAEENYAAVVGFNKMPGLDVYYAADTCFALKAAKRSPLYRMTLRSRAMAELERAVFHKDSGTEILLITENEKPFVMDYFGTAESRFHFLPPGISRDRLRPDHAGKIALGLREEFSIAPDHKLVLMIGTGFKRKGVDRAISAVAALPPSLKDKTTLMVLGDDKVKPWKRLAQKAGIESRVIFPGGREDAPRFLAAADLFLHTAYHENTGTVLVEALASELPVLATGVCGYAFHILRADAGLVVPEPFKQDALNRMLEEMLTSGNADDWRMNARRYVRENDLFSLPERAADVIERVAG